MIEACNPIRPESQTAHLLNTLIEFGGIENPYSLLLEGIIMAKSLFWFSDEAWKSLSPHLKRGQPGKPRVDDPTVISGLLHVLKTGCRWRDVPPVYGLPTTIAGHSAVSGSASSRRWRPLAPFSTSFQSTAATSKPIAGRVAQKGGV
jgi:transposase